MSFEIGPMFCHSTPPRVQGGIVTTAADMAAATLIFFLSRFERTPPTLELKVTFLSPCPAGAVHVVMRAVRMGRAVAFLEASILAGEPPAQGLIASEDIEAGGGTECVARMTTTVRLVEITREVGLRARGLVDGPHL